MIANISKGASFSLIFIRCKLGTIPILSQHIFGLFLTHTPYKNMNRTECQQKIVNFWTHPTSLLVYDNMGMVPWWKPGTIVFPWYRVTIRTRFVNFWWRQRVSIIVEGITICRPLPLSIILTLRSKDNWILLPFKWNNLWLDKVSTN